jgi:meso-butanediol dehydrogenase / (S,S)-butanediol dehydrogenase / diacetyl reductase
MTLEGKVAIVTGGGTGIGRAIVERLAADGACVCSAGPWMEAREDAAMTSAQDRVKTCVADVTDPVDVERIVQTALSFGRGIHVLVNNAAMLEPPGGVVDLDPAQWGRVIAVNLTGPFLMMKALIPYMIEAGGGSVVNISSVAGLLGVPGQPAYCASKGGLISLSKQVAVDYGADGVRCNVVCPGPTRTEMLVGNMTSFAEICGLEVESVLRTFSRDIPLHRVASPHELAGLCSFLASDDASFITAAVIPVDGGAVVVDVSGAAINRLAAERIGQQAHLLA